jgi:hypothetical protein
VSDRVGSRGERLEAVAQILILLAVGGLAGAVSFVHVHDWTVANGQLSWVGWTNAMVTELIQIAGGLEIRRRKRETLPTRAVMGVLVAAVAVSLTAQVAQAELTVFGWVVAALPALGFLTVVKIVMARAAATAQTVTATAGGPVTATGGLDLDRPVTATATRSDPVAVTAGSDRAREVGPGQTVTGVRSGPDLDPVRRDLDRGPGPGGRDRDLDLTGSGHAVHGPDLDPVVTATATRSGPVRTGDLTAATVSVGPDRTSPDLDLDLDRDRSDQVTDPDPDRVTAPPRTLTADPDRDRDRAVTGFDPDLLDRGRTALENLTVTGAPVNRGTFAMQLRRSGQPIATNTAGHLLRALKEATA